MSIFPSFERNPFFINAFKLADISPKTFKPKEIKESISGMAERIDYGDEVTIDGGAGGGYRVTIADLTNCEEILCDPKRRPNVELLVPEAPPLPRIDGVEEFLRQHKLTPKIADQFLRLDSLDVTPVLVAGLPVIPTPQFSTGFANQEFPSVSPLNLNVAKLLVKKRHRRG